MNKSNERLWNQNGIIKLVYRLQNLTSNCFFNRNYYFHCHQVKLWTGDYHPSDDRYIRTMIRSKGQWTIWFPVVVFSIRRFNLLKSVKIKMSINRKTHNTDYSSVIWWTCLIHLNVDFKECNYFRLPLTVLYCCPVYHKNSPNNLF